MALPHPSLLTFSRPSSVAESRPQIRCLGGQDSSSWLVVASRHGYERAHEVVSSSVISCMGTEEKAASEQLLSVRCHNSLEFHIQDEASCMQIVCHVSAACLIVMSSQLHETPGFTVLHLMKEVKRLGKITQLGKGRRKT